MNVKIIKCFVASPNDTKEEREICEKIFAETNKNVGNLYGCRIESNRWENDVRPGFGIDSQDVINAQIANDYNLFIGIMWKKFGTPTKRADSGTEEEFNIAFERLQKKDDVEIMFYFNNSPAPLDEINIEQLTKVNAFKEKIASIGGLYWKYNGFVEFEANLREHLHLYLAKKFKQNIIGNSDEVKNNNILKIHVRHILKERLDKALTSFSNQPIIWVNPVVSTTNEISQNSDDNYNKKVDLAAFVSNPKSVVIKSPPEFGLTCLSHFLVMEAWENDTPWLYLDVKEIKPHNIENTIKREAVLLGVELNKIKCIVIDSFNLCDTKSLKILKKISDDYEKIPIVVMETIDDSKFLNDPEQVKIERDFDMWHLLALPRSEIRKVVCEYNKLKNIGDDNKILSKMVRDLDCLNIHRTPYNCITLLKVSERYNDDSPVNRTQMIEMILFVLFNMDEIPKYKTKPDLKDCEYVLGRFCEDLIRKGDYAFSRDKFLGELEKFCSDKLIKLELSVVFDVLTKNNILVFADGGFAFRNTYWIFYFGAKRMHADSEFAEFVFKEKIYTKCPEIIEFYTGIDRNREDALQLLLDDIRETCNSVHQKVGFSDTMDPFGIATWMPTQENIEKIKSEISEDIIKSGLPAVVKDKFADKDYNQIRPYNQNIHNILEEYSLLLLIQKIKASSRALRNSDYVKPELKKALLKEIVRSWAQISHVLVALTPIIASNGEAAFQGANFILNGFFGNTFQEKVTTIFQLIPINIVGLFRDDIYSPKMGPLLFDYMNYANDGLNKHEFAILIAIERPDGWKACLEKYIVSIPTNSFYLYGIINAIKTQYRFSFASDEDIRHMIYLIKMGLAKHEFKLNKPGLDKVLKIDNSNLPKREADKNS